MFVVEKSWGFKIGFYKTATPLTRGDIVVINHAAGVVEKPADAEPARMLYLVDYVREELRADQTFEEAETIPVGAYVTLYNINEGCYTLGQDKFTAKPEAGNMLELASGGQLQPTGEINAAVAEVIYVEDISSTEYRVTIRPIYR